MKSYNELGKAFHAHVMSQQIYSVVRFVNFFLAAECVGVVLYCISVLIFCLE